MSRVHANGIEIEFDTFGKRTDRPLLLIMGLGTQMIGWPDGFCDKLANEGCFVVRFDNRDAGLSSKMDDAGIPDVMAHIQTVMEGGSIDTPYTLSDMAADAIGLLDTLGIERSHVCGLSMGGMIAQTMAIEQPGRILSLISMESSTGEVGLPEPSPEAQEAMFSFPPKEREANIKHRTGVFRAFSGGSDKFDEKVERELSALSYDRCFYPEGFARQFAAILASGGRKEALKSVSIPTLVIHGAHDPLVPPQHGRATAEAVPGAKLLVVEGLGHGLSYPDLWDEIVQAITAHTKATV
jgi:pimeloyl-ACP methyl ester carboxylesterase